MKGTYIIACLRHKNAHNVLENRTVAEIQISNINIIMETLLYDDSKR
jgi:hypothetical protein